MRILVLLAFLLVFPLKVTSIEKASLNKSPTHAKISTFSQNSDSTLQSSNDNITKKQSSRWGFLIRLLIWLLIIALVGVAIFLIYKTFKKYKRLESKNRRKRHKIDSLQRDLNKKRKDYRLLRNKFSNQKEKINNLQKKLRSAEQEIDKRHNSIDSKNEFENSNSPKSNEDRPKKKDLNNEKTLFFTVPNSDGEFDNKMSSSNPEGRNYYKIISEKDSKEGKIEFRSGELDASALDHRDSILRPVCEIKNSTASNPSRIENIAPGKVKRVGDKWVIEEKVKIKFQ
jgi:large-conductance mechanosensitive channel